MVSEKFPSNLIIGLVSICYDIRRICKLKIIFFLNTTTEPEKIEH